jgi:hypothetical protein
MNLVARNTQYTKIVHLTIEIVSKLSDVSYGQNATCWLRVVVNTNFFHLEPLLTDGTLMFPLLKLVRAFVRPSRPL